MSLLSSERIGTFSSALWISYMMFESQRKHLKYQTEIFLNRLIEVVCSEQQKITYEHKELALEIVVRFYRIPGKCKGLEEYNCMPRFSCFILPCKIMFQDS